ncbi:histone chaperone Rttp106-like-domain-containing protein [Pholiota molesta]|nr:histone chaperone Rttp106-like-domain-containing protein [Pholiota molesta]
MASETHYLRAIMPSLPTEIAQKIRSLCVTPANEIMLENLVRFIAGGDAASDSSKSVQEQWSEKQIATKRVLTTFLPVNISDKKRAREEDIAQDQDSQPKKPRLSPPTATANGNDVTPSGPLYTLHALSATSPVRKKVDITIHKNAITMTHPTSRAVESVIPLSAIKRAFIVPTRGKSKPHWTVILLSSDVPVKSRPGAPAENQQVIFGVDATSAAPFTTTSYIAAPNPPVPVIRPSPAVFRSVCAGTGASASSAGIPGVEAYRAAKAGSLWFAKEGILWGESKPCEFWPVDALLGRAEGLRVIGSGRTCTVVLTRRSAPAEDGQEAEEEEEDMGEESEFGMVDAKEREGINEWVRNHRHLFGKTHGEKNGKKEEETTKSRIRRMRIFDEREGSEDEGDENDAEEGGNLDPARHPLLRPGAMPKMSKAALEMAVELWKRPSLAGRSRTR